VSGLELYRATARTAPAHIVETRPAISAEALTRADGGDLGDRGCAGGRLGDSPLSGPEAVVV